MRAILAYFPPSFANLFGGKIPNVLMTCQIKTECCAIEAICAAKTKNSKEFFPLKKCTFFLIIPNDVYFTNYARTVQIPFYCDSSCYFSLISTYFSTHLSIIIPITYRKIKGPFNFVTFLNWRICLRTDKAVRAAVWEQR